MKGVMGDSLAQEEPGIGIFKEGSDLVKGRSAGEDVEEEGKESGTEGDPTTRIFTEEAIEEVRGPGLRRLPVRRIGQRAEDSSAKKMILSIDIYARAPALFGSGTRVRIFFS